MALELLLAPALAQVQPTQLTTWEVVVVVMVRTQQQRRTKGAPDRGQPDRRICLRACVGHGIGIIEAVPSPPIVRDSRLALYLYE